ncbi:MAG: hypothetical protein FWF56_03560 [Firmicutes bacterium]|nr:hypothetical protein [Bacillota bacterium]
MKNYRCIIKNGNAFESVQIDGDSLEMLKIRAKEWLNTAKEQHPQNNVFKYGQTLFVEQNGTKIAYLSLKTQEWWFLDNVWQDESKQTKTKAQKPILLCEQDSIEPPELKVLKKQYTVVFYKQGSAMPKELK